MSGDARKTLRAPGSLEGIRRVAAAFDAFSRRHGLSRQVVGAVQVALDEVLSNAVRHGYGGGVEGRIEVSMALRDEWLEIEVADDADPFDPLEVPEPDTGTPLERRAPGGLGLLLVRRLMDGVEYEHSEGLNRLRLRKRLRG